MSEHGAPNVEADVERPIAFQTAVLDPVDQARLRLGLLALQRDMGDALQFALYDAEFGEYLRTSQDDATVSQYLSLVDQMRADVAVAVRARRNPNLNWDHPFVRRLVADRLILPQEL